MQGTVAGVAISGTVLPFAMPFRPAVIDDRGGFGCGDGLAAVMEWGGHVQIPKRPRRWSRSAGPLQ